MLSFKKRHRKAYPTILCLLSAVSLSILPGKGQETANTSTPPAVAHFDLADPNAGATLFDLLVARNLDRESKLRQYEGMRTYRVLRPSGKVVAEAEISMRFQAPGEKRFQVITSKGSSLVSRLAFNPLMKSETEAAAGKGRQTSSITPANYRFLAPQPSMLEGRSCYVVQAVPKRKDKYLFEGKVWIDAEDFAVAKIEGQPAKSPSFWLKKVNFVRKYQKIGSFWLPLQDETTSQIKIVGTYILTIDYLSYKTPEGTF